MASLLLLGPGGNPIREVAGYRRLVINALLGALLTFGVGRNASGQAQMDSLAHCVSVTVTYDRMEGTSLVETEDDRIPGTDFDIQASAMSAGRRLRPGPLRLRFHRKGDDWMLLKAHGLTLLLDGVTRIRPTTKHEGTVNNGVQEFVYATLTLSQAKVVGAATKIEGRLGIFDFELPTPFARAIGQAARFMEAGAAADAEKWACFFPRRKP